MSKLNFGFIIGGGTGEHIFETIVNPFLRVIEKRENIKINVKKSGIYKTYWELSKYYSKLLQDNNKPKAIANLIKKIEHTEAEKITDFLRSFAEKGKVVFRTAVNAGTLYKVRKDLNAIKVIDIKLKDKVLNIIRDETNGFYVWEKYNILQQMVKGEIAFKKTNLQKIIKYIKKNYNYKNKRVIFIYKYHLLTPIFEHWVKELLPNAEIYQPDTGIDILLRKLNEDAILVFGNEIGDVIYEFLILHYNLGTKEILHTKNIYLDLDVVEFQTVHGSSDDLVWDNKLHLFNPIATLRALSQAISLQLQKDYASVLENILKIAQKQGFLDENYHLLMDSKKFLSFVLKKMGDI